MTNTIVDRLRKQYYGELLSEAADEIERLQRKLLAEENAYDILRLENEHLQADRNNLAIELQRLLLGGCARNQNTTQYCAEAVAFQEENKKLSEKIEQLEADHNNKLFREGKL